MTRGQYSEVTEKDDRRHDAIENEKKRRAAIEDYEGAALIKKALINAQSSFDLLHEMNGFMLQAAAEEDYEEAHRLKVKRNRPSYI